MADLEDRLQTQLELLEAGKSGSEPTPADQDEGELAALLRLAAALKEVEAPAMTARRSQAIRSQVLRHGQQSKLKKSPKRITWWRRPAFAGAFLFLALSVIAITLFLGGFIARLGVFDSRVGSIVQQEGLVEINPSGASSGWSKVDSSTQLESGHLIRTGPGSSASIRYADGSRTRLGPNTEMVLTTLEKEGESLQVELTQHRGETTHEVSELAGEVAYFLVNTPGGTARVRGTIFQVSIDRLGTARVAVGAGQVDFLAGGDEVVLNPGQVTTVSQGTSPSPPAYPFSGQGRVQAIAGTEWLISGVLINVINQTTLHGSPEIDDAVRVTGRILDDGLWLADEIFESSDPGTFFMFTGMLDSVGEAGWRVSGFPLAVNPETALDAGLLAGELVNVTFLVNEAGVWQALSIRRLDDIPEKPTPTPAPTPDPAAQPSLSFTPDELVSTACATNVSYTGTLINTGSPPDDYAANVQLGYMVIQGGAYVEAVSIAPDFWEIIPAGEQVNFSISISLLESWLQAPEAAEVRLRLFIADETNRPDHHPTRLTVTAVLQCGATPVPTTPPPPDPLPTPTPTPTTEVGDSGSCTGADPHPTGARLASQYGVSYLEIMGWFCSGFGFGEIELAYDLQRQSGVPAQQIFGMRRSGLGWGAIKKELNPKPNGKPPKDK